MSRHTFDPRPFGALASAADLAYNAAPTRRAIRGARSDGRN